MVAMQLEALVQQHSLGSLGPATASMFRHSRSQPSSPAYHPPGSPISLSQKNKKKVAAAEAAAPTTPTPCEEL